MAGTTTYYGVTYPTSTDYVKDGATAIQTVATGFDSAVAIPTYNAQTGATYTFVLSDTGKTVTASNASASTYTIPPTASVAWTANTTLQVTNLGAGVVTFAAGAGVTVTNTANTLAQYASAELIRTGLNAWTVVPKSGAASGLTLIKTQTIGTTVSSVAVTSAFSATYDTYKIVIAGGVGSATTDLRFSLTGGTSVYNSTALFATYSTGGSTTVGFQNTAFFNIGGTCDSDYIDLNMDLTDPFLAKFTRFNSRNAQSLYAGTNAGVHKQAVSFSGFTLAPASGTLTGGEIRVYGYQNS